MGALALWAVLGAALLLFFVTSYSPLFLLKLGGTWPHCASAVATSFSSLFTGSVSGHSGLKDFLENLMEGFEPVLWGRAEKPLSHSQSWER